MLPFFNIQMALWIYLVTFPVSASSVPLNFDQFFAFHDVSNTNSNTLLPCVSPCELAF